VAFRTDQVPPATTYSPLAAEYFYNGLGYNDYGRLPRTRPAHSQTLREPATFFYLDATTPAFSLPPGTLSWTHTFTLRNLANLSDRSGITRFDYSFILLHASALEAFGAVPLG